MTGNAGLRRVQSWSWLDRNKMRRVCRQDRDVQIKIGQLGLCCCRKDRPGGADQGFQRPGDPAGQDGGEEAVAEVRVCFALSALGAIDRFAKRSITGQLVVSI